MPSRPSPSPLWGAPWRPRAVHRRPRPRPSRPRRCGSRRSKKGAPYKYGAQGPKRFDCSGLTLYAYKRAGKRLPRTAAAQYNRTRHIKAGSRKGGDLVFFHSGSGVYHVGLYAGGGRIWHAPKTGTVVRLERIWTKKVWYGHVR